MKKLIISGLAVFFSIFCAFAQDDSTAFVGGQWTQSTPSEGITLKQCHFASGELFGGSNQFVSVLEVAPGRRLAVATAPEGTLQLTSSIAEQTGALASVNGSFFRMRDPYGGVTYTRVDGRKVDSNNRDGDPVRSMRQNGAVAVRHGKTYILKADRLASWEEYIAADYVMVGGPLMMVAGEDVVVPKVNFNTYRHPRTAVGKKADGTVVLVTVDGRTSESAGVSIFELRSIMKWLGCTDALNLDGGGSTAMTIGSAIVNHPCDNKKFDNKGERKVANTIIVL